MTEDGLFELPAVAASKGARQAVRAPASKTPAEQLPVARVCVDLALPHLDRPFDYLVPASMDAKVVVGGRVRVRFAGQKVDGYVLDRVAASEHAGNLSFLERAVSAEPVVSPEIARLARAVADRYAGSLADVLRLAVPPRHARAEAAVPPRATPEEAAVPPHAAAGEAAVPPRAGPEAAAAPGGTGEPVAAAGERGAQGSAAVGERGARESAAAGTRGSGAVGSRAELAVRAVGDGLGEGLSGAPAFPATSGWAAYPAGAAFLRALADGRAPRAVWTATPGEDWAARCAEAVAATLSGGRGAVVVVPDGRDLNRLDRALVALLGEGRHVALSAATGPEERYTRFVTALRGHVRAVIGTRAAIFAPVADLGLVVIFDDGDDVHADPHAPYPHAREVLLTRAELAGAAALVAGHSRTAEGQLLLATGWAKELTADRESLRARAPRVVTTGDDVQQSRDAGATSSRLPSVALQAARAALAAGRPVLVQVPRRGYIPAVACETCRAPARCPHCSGPLALESGVLGGTAGVGGASPEHSGPSCRWCGRGATGFACPHCGGRRLRASVVGARRTADEMGRAFAGVPVRTSGRGELLDTVPDGPALVVATPGAEPVADAGYGAVLLLDTWALLTRADLRAGEEALRRWLSAAALARADGTVVIVADASVPVVQALVRFDPAWYAARELDERAELGFPPAVRVGSLTGSPAAIAELLAGARLPQGVDELGPVPVLGGDEGVERLLLRVPRSTGPALARALHEAAGVRSAHRAKEPVRIQVDPLELL